MDTIYVLSCTSSGYEYEHTNIEYASFTMDDALKSLEVVKKQIESEQLREIFRNNATYVEREVVNSEDDVINTHLIYFASEDERKIIRAEYKKFINSCVTGVNYYLWTSIVTDETIFLEIVKVPIFKQEKVSDE